MSQVFKRRIVREKVLQILYAYELNKDSLKALTDGVLSDVEDKTDKEFTRMTSMSKSKKELITGNLAGLH
jgi:transcription termination factor NusB